MENQNSQVNQPPAPPPATPVSPAPVTPKNKIPLLLGAVLLLLLAGSGVSYFGTQNSKPAEVTQEIHPSPSPVTIRKEQPTPDPTATADWKLYTNTKYGFSFEYPSDYRTECSVCKQESDFATTTHARFVPLEDDGYGTITLFISESAIKKKTDESLKEYLSRALGLGSISDDPNITKTIQVGGTEALQTVQVNTGVESVIRTYFIHKDSIYEIYFSETKSIPANMRKPITSYPNLNVYNQILTSFKFTQ